MRRILGIAAIAVGMAATGGTALAAGPHVLFRSTLDGAVPLPAGVDCDGLEEGLRSMAAPLIGVAPDDPSEVRSAVHAHGERVHLGAASHDGGKTWRRSAIADATRCLGGPAERDLTVNPLFDVGAGGVAYLGQSWFNHPYRDRDLWRYGVVAHAWRDADVGWRPGVTPPGGAPSSQNGAVAADPADPDRVAMLWTHIDQVPNPITYAPTGSELRFTTSDDGGRTWTDPVVVHRPVPDELVVNGRLARTSSGGYVAIFDRGALKDFPTAQLGLASFRLPLYAVWSDDGVTWSQPKRIGEPAPYIASDPDGRFTAQAVSVKPDLATGPDGRVAAVWSETGSHTVRLARSGDGGRTWSQPESTVALDGDPLQPAVAFDGRGALGLFFYDFGEDRPHDDVWSLQPRFAVQPAAGGAWRDVALDEPFDLQATERCSSASGLGDPFTRSCSPGSHAGSLGVQQDAEGLPSGFAVGYTVGPPLAGDGFTDARFARVSSTNGR